MRAALCALALVALTGCTTAARHASTSSSTTTPTSTSSSTSASAPVASGTASNTAHLHCRGGNPLANVYHPYRLQVRIACLSVTGTVTYAHREDDGDLHVDLALPSGKSRLLNEGNFAHEHGDLVTEIVPADQPGCTPGSPPPVPSSAHRGPSYSYGICTGADLPTPSPGDRVTVIGPYVLDADHGWMEIHPVLGMAVAPPVTTTTTTAPPPAGSPAPAQSSPPSRVGQGCYLDPEGHCYRAGEYCPSSMHGQTISGQSGPLVCVDRGGWRWEPA